MYSRIPRQKLFFDPFRSATFNIVPNASQFEKFALKMQVAFDYVKGFSTDKIVDKIFRPATQL